MDIVRLGMVGARFGATLHLQNLLPMRGRQVEIVGVCARSRESADAFAQRFGIPFVTTDFRALLERKDVDAVDLCVPPSLHHNFAIQAAEAGKHIIMTNAVLHTNMTQNSAVQAYAPAPEIFGDEYFSEKLETKAGWSFPSPDEDWFRGYPQEMRDFVKAILEDREPKANVDLAVDCVEVIYAAYLSAQEGRRVDLKG